MGNNILPYVECGVFYDGSIIKALPRCEQKYNVGGCANFYCKLRQKIDGFYMCPSGFTVYKRTKNDIKRFYCGIRVKHYYDRKKIIEKNNVNETEFSVLNQELFKKLILLDDVVRELYDQLSWEREIHKDLLHDVRKLDGLVKNKTEEILAIPEQEKQLDSFGIIPKIKNIHAMEELISCKYSVYDLVSNIDILSVGNKSTISIYKKFDKARYILFNYKNKGIPINFKGETDYIYKVNVNYFDILPFLLLENAVKYSAPNREVLVSFVEYNGTLKVSIDSFGPYCPQGEVTSLFSKHYRGNNAKKVTGEGNGIGLYLVKQICEQHGIDISIETEFIKKINGVEYGYFTVYLNFGNDL